MRNLVNVSTMVGPGGVTGFERPPIMVVDRETIACRRDREAHRELLSHHTQRNNTNDGHGRGPSPSPYRAVGPRRRNFAASDTDLSLSLSMTSSLTLDLSSTTSLSGIPPPPGAPLRRQTVSTTDPPHPLIPPTSPTITPPTPQDLAITDPFALPTQLYRIVKKHATHPVRAKKSDVPPSGSTWPSQKTSDLYGPSESSFRLPGYTTQYLPPTLKVQRKIMDMYEQYHAVGDVEKLVEMFGEHEEHNGVSEAGTRRLPKLDEVIGMFLRMEAGNAIGKLPDKDLTMPITHYFINSSHNTYLEGHQWASSSTPEAYIRALQCGCRCVEIDVWNGDVDSGIKGERLPQFVASFLGLGGDKPRAASRSRSRSTSRSSAPSPNRRQSSISIGTMASSRSKSHSRQGSNTSGESMARSTGSSNAVREPLVMHGWTACPPCGFREVCRAIAENAFTHNSLPIIVSLEIHTDAEQQELMVQIMNEEWGDMLLSGPLEGCDPQFRVPQLGQLQNKILVKVKKHKGSRSLRSHVRLEKLRDLTALTPEVVSRRGLDDDTNPYEHARSRSGTSINSSTSWLASESEDSQSGDESVKSHTPTASMIDVTSFPTSTVIVGSRSADWEPQRPTRPLSLTQKIAQESASAEKKKKGSAKDGIVPSLGHLAVYTHGEHFKSIASTSSKKPTHIYSISEKNIPRIYSKDPAAVFAHNKNFFMRAYPAVTRIDSTNPDPSQFWRRGVQMVAMNWQTLDEGMMINHAMFADEDGWVEKPPGFRLADKDSETHYDACVYKTMDLKITVHAGHGIAPGKAGVKGALTDAPGPARINSRGVLPGTGNAGIGVAELSKAVEPVVTMTLHTEPRDPHLEKKAGISFPESREITYTQRTTPGKGVNPDWDDGCILTWANIPRVVEKFTYLRIVVEESGKIGAGGRLLCWQCFRIDRLREGFRFLPVMNTEGVPCGYLVVTIEMDMREMDDVIKKGKQSQERL